MVSRDGAWRVEEIRVCRDRRRLALLRVYHLGSFVAEVIDMDELPALGVPVDHLVEEDAGRGVAGGP